MRVCVISHLYPNPRQPAQGGFVRREVLALRAAGVEASVIAPVPLAPAAVAWLKPRWRALRAIPPLVTWDEGEVRYPRFFTLPAARWRAREGASLAKAVAPLVRGGHFDLVHAHTAVPDGDAARRLGLPFVCTIHGYDAVWLRQRGPVRDAILATFRDAARVICVSETVRARCLEHDPRPDHYCVIHHGVEVPPELPARRQAGPPRIVSVGNLIAQKGFAELLQAFARARAQQPEARLTIIGGGPERTRLESLARGLGVADSVEFTGPLPHAELLSHHARADAFCLISRDEGFGLVYLEAMSMGVPIVGSAGEGIADVVTDGENGLLVPACDAEAAAAALLRLLGNRELANRLGLAGRETARALSWERNAQQHVALYREVVGA